jgi:hypothetical protein
MAKEVDEFLQSSHGNITGTTIGWGFHISRVSILLQKKVIQDKGMNNDVDTTTLQHRYYKHYPKRESRVVRIQDS